MLQGTSEKSECHSRGLFSTVLCIATPWHVGGNHSFSWKGPWGYVTSCDQQSWWILFQLVRTLCPIYRVFGMSLLVYSNMYIYTHISVGGVLSLMRILPSVLPWPPFPLFSVSSFCLLIYYCIHDMPTKMMFFEIWIGIHFSLPYWLSLLPLVWDLHVPGMFIPINSTLWPIMYVSFFGRLVIVVVCIVVCCCCLYCCCFFPVSFPTYRHSSLDFAFFSLSIFSLVMWQELHLLFSLPPWQIWVVKIQGFGNEIGSFTWVSQLPVCWL